jgi:hypothetical protein
MNVHTNLNCPVSFCGGGGGTGPERSELNMSPSSVNVGGGGGVTASQAAGLAHATTIVAGLLAITAPSIPVKIVSVGVGVIAEVTGNYYDGVAISAPGTIVLGDN